MPAYSYLNGRLSIKGTIQNVQTWSINIGFTGPGTVTNTDLSTWLASLDTAIATWWNTGNGVKYVNPSYVQCTSSSAEYYAANSAVPMAQAAHTFASALPGNSTSYLPTQCAAVHSLHTNAAGRSNRGRLYVPVTGALLSSGPVLGTSNVDAMASSMSTLLHAINISSLAASAPQVIVRGSSVLSGYPVTSLSVDNEVDIQRRRADKLFASYTKTVTV